MNLIPRLPDVIRGPRGQRWLREPPITINRWMQRNSELPILLHLQTYDLHSFDY